MLVEDKKKGGRGPMSLELLLTSSCMEAEHFHSKVPSPQPWELANRWPGCLPTQ